MTILKKRLILIVFILVASISIAGLASFLFLKNGVFRIKSNNYECNVAGGDEVEVTPPDVEDDPEGYDLANATDKGDGVYNLTDAKYDEHSSFGIYNRQGLRAFAGIVNSNNRNFSGKTIYLNADIDYGGDPLSIGYNYAYDDRYLSGAFFEGNNHTISNFQISSYNNTYVFGFFTSLGKNCTLQNLRLKNFKGPNKENANKASDVFTGIGALVGYTSDGVTIKNCVVEDFTVQSTGITTLVCGLVYGSKGNLTIENCLVKNHSVRYNNVPFGDGDYVHYAIGPNKGWVAEGTLFESSKQIKISKCVVNNPDTKIFIHGNGDVTSINSVSVSLTNCISEANTTTGLSCSNIGGDTQTESSTWYYGGDDYNDGYPYLRQFIDWVTISIKSNNEEWGTVSKSSIELPSDADASKLNGSTSVPAYLYGQTIGVTITNGCKFVKWVYDSSTKTYTAKFEARIIKLRFWGLLYGDMALINKKTGETTIYTWMPKTDEELNSTSPEVLEFNVPYGTTLDVETTPCVKDGCYQEITISFIVDGINYEIKYTPDSKYYINKVSSINGIFETQNIEPPFSDSFDVNYVSKIKSYGVSFG